MRNTLRERAELLAQLVKRFQVAQERAEEIELLRTRRGELREVVEGLEEVVTAVEVMRSARIETALPGELAGLLETAKALRSKQTEDEKSILKPRALQTRPFTKATSETKEALRDSWRAWIVGSAEGKGLADILRAFAPLRDAAKTIDAKRQGLERKANRLPSSPKTIREVEKLRSELQGVLDSLDEKGVDEDVLAFLKQVVRGVTLGDLLGNKKILKWIGESDLGDQFTVRAV